jgi:hypothetical protein
LKPTPMQTKKLQGFESPSVTHKNGVYLNHWTLRRMAIASLRWRGFDASTRDPNRRRTNNPRRDLDTRTQAHEFKVHTWRAHHWNAPRRRTRWRQLAGSNAPVERTSPH